MGCCILGAIIFGLLLRVWGRIRSLAGFTITPAHRLEPAMWRLGQVEAVLPRQPLISARFIGAMALIVGLIIVGFTVHARMPHVRLELAYAAEALNLPVQAILSLCGA
jgi:hypothetical protein